MQLQHFPHNPCSKFGELNHVCCCKGGETAIRNAHRLLDDRRRGDRSVPALRLDQIVEQLGLAVDRVMAEGSLYDRELAALAVRQSRGDLIEAIFLVRAYRTTLPRFGYSLPLETANMLIERRISATYKDLPGGQLWDRPSIIPTVCLILHLLGTSAFQSQKCVQQHQRKRHALPTFLALTA